MRWLRTFLGIAETAQARAQRLAQARWVVVDVETSGLDRGRDRLLAIGAVAVRGLRIDLADSFEVVVRQSQPSERGNILVHGIGAQAQLAGVEPAQACASFLDYVGQSPLVAFHADFDRAFLARAIKAWVGVPPPTDWLDLAALAPALHPQSRAHSLDEWLEHFGLPIDARHDAAADALATAMLFLVLLRQLPASRRSFDDLRRLSLQRRWAGH